MIAGLASLWLPDRRHDPAWRAFAAYTGSAIVFFWLYTAVKAAYLSTQVFTRDRGAQPDLPRAAPDRRDGRLLLEPRRGCPGLLAATAFTACLVLYYGYQLDDPYFESPGYGIAAFANRNLSWDQHDIRIALAVTCAVALPGCADPARRAGCDRCSSSWPR